MEGKILLQVWNIGLKKLGIYVRKILACVSKKKKIVLSWKIKDTKQC